MQHLTKRQQEIVDLTRAGKKISEIAAELGIRPGTVKSHRKMANIKIAVNEAQQAAMTHAPAPAAEEIL